jgi:hypothetical protein
MFHLKRKTPAHEHLHAQATKTMADNISGYAQLNVSRKAATNSDAKQCSRINTHSARE